MIVYALDSICVGWYICSMDEGVVEFQDAFDPEFEKLPDAVQDAILARNKLLKQYGPRLGRPYADTLWARSTRT